MLILFILTPSRCCIMLPAWPVQWAFGLLSKRHGHAFPIRTDVLASMAFVVARLASGFTEQVGGKGLCRM